MGEARRRGTLHERRKAAVQREINRIYNRMDTRPMTSYRLNDRLIRIYDEVRDDTTND